MSSLAVPIGQPPPTINMTTPLSVSLEWAGPSQPNGIISSYSVQRRLPSLSHSLRDLGTAFDGSSMASFLPVDVNLGGFRNTIRLMFRSFSSSATLLYYINSARTDYLALELRDGIPWFFFDPGRGAAVAVPSVPPGVGFNDGQWHTLEALQNGRSSRITVDGIFTGDSISPGGATDSVISSNQPLYVGAIPEGVPRSTSFGSDSPNTTLEGGVFSGCLFGVFLNRQALDLENDVVGEIDPSRGCPISITPGWAFIGGGYVLYPSNTIVGSRFSWLFDIRTTHDEGLLFFASSSDGQSYIAAEIRESFLHLTVSDNSSASSAMASSVRVCDGQWHSVVLDQSDSEVFLGVDGLGSSLFLSQSDTVFSSPVYLGGLDQSLAEDIGLASGMPFSGCMRDIQPPSPSPVESSVLVRYNGCFNSSLDSSCSAPWVDLDAGTDMELTDNGLRPFTGQCPSTISCLVLICTNTLLLVCRVSLSGWCREFSRSGSQ